MKSCSRAAAVEYGNRIRRWMDAAAHHHLPGTWINPGPQGVWQYRQSISVIQQRGAAGARIARS
jgi:uncharacterized protein with von Willebrand factor type A (vWA) domain